MSRYRVHLLIVSHRFKDLSAVRPPWELCHDVAHLPAGTTGDPWLLMRRLIHRVSPKLFSACFQVPPEWAYVTSRRLEAAARLFPGVSFAAVHVFRLYMAPFAQPFVGRSPAPVCRLDLDDIESVTRRRIADLHGLNGERGKASARGREAELYRAMEGRLLPRFDVVFVCSEGDKRTIQDAYGCRRVTVVPNVVRIASGVPEGSGTGPFRFLFVGTLGYYPNRDAVTYFCDRVLPLIRRGSRCAFVITVVGSGLTASLARRLARAPEVEAVGYVEDLGPVYADADAVIVPVRAGGGSRIKVLEAFSYRRPVVSTSVGAEGIAARHEEHLLIGDGAEGFAAGCLRLMADPGLRKRLADNASDLVAAAYTVERMEEAADLDGPCEKGPEGVPG